MAKILIVDDEARIRELIREHLQYAGFQCEEATDGSAALAQLGGGGIDLVILDVMMPFVDGMTCLREMRARHIDTPVIMLTARGEEYDKLAGLENGADDYVVKPFSPRELVARVKAVLGRTMPRAAEDTGHYTFGQLEIDTPEEIAFIEIRKRGILEVCYFVSAYSDYCPLSPITENFTQESGKRPIRDMLSGFLYTMHSVGVHHKDLHIGNILYKENGSGGYDFQIIDTNRMKFGVFLTQRQRLINLQRLSCPASAYLYILEQYARIAHIDPEYLQLKGAFTRLIYEFRRYYRHKLKNQCRKILHK